MTKRHGIAAALCVLTAACSGGAGSGGNAAETKTFKYGAPSPASSDQAAALSAQLSLGTTSSLDASGAQSLADFSGVTEALLGTGAPSLLRAASPARQALVAGKAAAAGELTSTTGDVFDEPACVTVTQTSVSMKACTITIDDPATSTTGKVHVDGSLSVSNGTLTWDLTMSANIVSSGITETARVHEDGTLTVTPTTIKGKMLDELSATVTANGFSQSEGVAESLTIDVTYQSSPPPPCVTGGTLEAKRVWTQRPAGYTTTELPDKAAKVTWTGCDQGTIAFSL